MSRHIDLIAVAALLMMVAFAARVHEMMRLHIGASHVFQMHVMHPVVIVPPHPPAVPRLPHLRVTY